VIRNSAFKGGRGIDRPLLDQTTRHLLLLWSRDCQARRDLDSWRKRYRKRRGGPRGDRSLPTWGL
jgi:hypothetical protein